MVNRKRHGVHFDENNIAQFALWAPDAQSVSININGKKIPMQKVEAGWFEGCVDCLPGASYCFLINETLQVPDPASRAQVADANGLSRIVEPHYPWKIVDWRGLPWHEAIIYEIHAGLLGGFRQLTQYLPQWVELGITAIQLMPINECLGKRNWGYDGVLLFAPESAYGTPEELKDFIDNAHAAGIMVFLDVVYNHFGLDGYKMKQYASQFFRTDIKNTWGMPSIFAANLCEIFSMKMP